MRQMEAAGVELWREKGVVDCEKQERFRLTLSNGELLECDALLVASGSSSKVLESVRKLGHTIEPLVPRCLPLMFLIPS
jgi:predicted flavoprotein YhiN